MSPPPLPDRRPPPEVVSALGKGGWFTDLPSGLRAEILRGGRLSVLAEGASLFRQDAPPSGLHAVITGALRIVGLASDGAEKVMGIVRPGDWTGFLSCLDGRPHVYSAVAQSDMQVFSLAPAQVAAIFERDVATFRRLLTPELTAARKVYSYVIEDVGEPARRVAAQIISLGRWPYAAPEDGPVVPLDGLRQADLAMSVKISRQTMNAVLRSFESRGLIELGYGRLRITDLPALEQIAEPATPRAAD